MTVKKAYIDSHWLVYVFQGVVSLLFGWYIMFTNNKNLDVLIAVVATVLLALGIIEMFNVIYRSRQQYTWALSLAIAIIEVCVAFLLFFTMHVGTAFQLTVIAVYTFCRGIFEILIGLKSVDDSTDKFIWLVCGICGAILGFVIFNSGHFTNTATFLQFFGTYMMIFGIGNLVYGFHNKDQAKEYRLEQSAKRKQAAARRSQNNQKLAAKSAKSTKATKATKTSKFAKSARPTKSKSKKSLARKRGKK